MQTTDFDSTYQTDTDDTTAVLLQNRFNNEPDDIASNNISNNDDEPPFTVLSGSLNQPDPVISRFNKINKPEPYYYDKPQIPFEYDNQPAQNVEETFKGYNYPTPKNPFPYPTTSETIPDLPGATARLISVKN